MGWSGEDRVHCLPPSDADQDIDGDKDQVLCDSQSIP